MSEELKPCPFCGTSELLGFEPSHEGGWTVVKCRKCGCSGSTGRSTSEPEAVAWWNRRAITAKPSEAEGVADHIGAAIDNLVHDNYERSQAGSRYRQIDADLIRTTLSAVTAARDDLHAELLREIEKTCQLGMDCNGLKAELRDMTAERDRLRAEIERMRGMLDAALYYVPEHKHDLRELISAAMAAKEA